MAVQIDVAYEGDLHCAVLHGPSQDRILTDAPLDNRGRGQHFSPTDLVAAAMGSCMLTIMGIAALEHGLDMRGARATVRKEMSAVPRRHIARLEVTIYLAERFEARQRSLLEAAARGCPVHASLGPDTHVELRFLYG